MDYASQRAKLVDGLVLRGYVKTGEVAAAMKKVRREEFVPDEIKSSAYEDRPFPIGHGQTISAPHMIAIMTEALRVRESDKILEVGSGSGYQAAVLAEIARKGFVYTIERLKPLAEWARSRLASAGYENVKVFESDGTTGLKEHAPYDKIIVTAGAPHVPNALVEQLAVGGRLLVPVGGRGYQELLCLDKTDEGAAESNLGGCVFVPLIGEDGW